ncbi:AAA family ATPase [Martelella soudanensis]|uniref:AAA family ATPase n=1 Tax=unclassified Martelella TaxID=2629616 RepID=UPI0015DED537|nr:MULTISPECIES: AAA family ATPase [unclassified Martelella]
MTRIPFVEAKLFPVGDSETDLEYRFENHLRKLREDKQSVEELSEEDDWHRSRDMVTSRDRARIRRWAVRIIKGREKVSGIMHLRAEDRKAIEMLNTGVQVVEIESEARADEIASALHAEMPWMAPATELFWQAMRQSVGSGMAGFRLPPLLLNGPPGIGKSVWARKVSEVLRVPLRTIDAAGEQASFAVAGSQRGWGSAHAGKPIQTVIQHKVANPIIVIDEIEKAGIAVSTGGSRCSLPDALLSLLELATAARWECPYYQLSFDMSWIDWILTSNSLVGIPEPLQTRLNIVNLSVTRPSDMITFAQREGRKRRLSELSVDVIAEVIERQHARRQPLNLRSVNRMLARAEVLEKQPMLP